MITYFKWQELIKTNTGLPNTPDNINIIENLVDLARELDWLRKYFGSPIIVNSGYRSKEVNEKVGGVKTSHHTMGLAADITAKDFELLKQRVLENIARYDQVIIYPNRHFIHISIGPLKRNMVIYNET